MVINAGNLRTAVAAMLVAMPSLERELNEADARLGDGDTGSMMSRLVQSLAKVELDDGDIGGSMLAMARAVTEATGSSLGTIIATGLTAAGRKTRGKANLPVAELGDLLAVACDAMQARGGAQLGDKTVVDSINAIASAISGRDDPDMVRSRAVSAALSAVQDFRGRPIRIGRARMFGDQTRDLDDPGMIAVYWLVLHIAGAHSTDGGHGRPSR